MPDTATLLLFATACLALTATPGPDMLLIASRSASQGRELFAATGRMTRWPNYFLAAVFAGLAVRLAVSSRD